MAIGLHVRALAGAMAGLALAGAAAGGQAGEASPAAVDTAVRRGAAWLAGQFTEAGPVKQETDANDVTFGGRTALGVYALLAAGRDANAPPLRPAIDWLVSARLNGTYAVALRARALGNVSTPAARKRLAADARWLVESAGPAGGYGYRPHDAGGAEWRWDNSNTQMAVLGVDAAARAGVAIPQAYWLRQERHWRAEQQGDGGWGYSAQRAGVGIKTYGSMTAAGVASLLICLDHLDRPEYAQCRPGQASGPIERGLGWLAERYSITANPGLGSNRYGYYLYALSRVGMASGRERLGGPWYADGARHLLARQHSDGSWWAVEARAFRETCFALLFLARSRAPMVLAKIEYDGPWNLRPRDAAGVARWMARAFERPLRWKVWPADAEAGAWRSAPVAYLSGRGAFELTDEQVEHLRAFILAGGTLLSEAACGSATFTADVHRLWKRLFPDATVRRLGEDHPVYSMHFDIGRRGGLMGLSNGVRELAIHSAGDWSLGLHRGGEANGPTFRLASNAVLYATGRNLSPEALGGVPELPPRPADAAPLEALKMARLKHGGNWNPEPLAWPAMAAVMQRYGRKLVIDAIEPARLDAARWPVAVMTGTEGFELSEADRRALRGFAEDGGLVIADAAGGAPEFLAAVEKQILPLWPNALVGRISPEHAVYRGPAELGEDYYRPGTGVVGEAQRPRLGGVQVDGQLAVVYSAEDLTAGLVGYWKGGIRGYAPPAARKLMANLLDLAAGRGAPRGAETQPASRPGSAPRSRPVTRPASGRVTQPAE